MNMLKGLILALITTFTLAACGGGGGGDSTATGSGSTPTGSTQTNPLAKYAGTYYACDGNSKVTLSFTVNGNDGLHWFLNEDTTANDGCSGPVIGTYKWTAPVSMTYKAKISATMPPVTLLPYSDVVDEILISVSNIKPTLSGSAVNGNCVKYSYATTNGSYSGEKCYSLAEPTIAFDGALYLTSDNKYLVQFVKENAVLQAEGIYSRDPSFNYKSLIRD
jgi:hypothetical protein